MKAKCGNLTVDVWKIDKENIDDWVEAGIQKGKMSWRVPVREVEKLGEIPKPDLAKAEYLSNWKNLTVFRKLDQKFGDVEAGQAEFFSIKGGYGGTFGFVGDYLIHNEALPNHYQIISQDKAEKELTFM